MNSRNNQFVLAGLITTANHRWVEILFVDEALSRTPDCIRIIQSENRITGYS